MNSGLPDSKACDPNNYSLLASWYTGTCGRHSVPAWLMTATGQRAACHGKSTMAVDPVL